MSEVALTVATGLGSASVTAALVYSARQAKTLARQYGLENVVAERALLTERAANDLKLMDYVMRLDLLFVERPELRPYFYNGLAPPDEPVARGQVVAAAEYIVDLADCVANMMRLGQLDNANRHGWIVALGWYGRSPVIRELVENAGAAWLPETISILLKDPPHCSHPANGEGDSDRPTSPQ
jgi:hypothetical protein